MEKKSQEPALNNRQTDDALSNQLQQHASHMHASKPRHSRRSLADSGLHVGYNDGGNDLGINKPPLMCVAGVHTREKPSACVRLCLGVQGVKKCVDGVSGEKTCEIQKDQRIPTERPKITRHCKTCVAK